MNIVNKISKTNNKLSIISILKNEINELKETQNELNILDEITDKINGMKSLDHSNGSLNDTINLISGIINKLNKILEYLNLKEKEIKNFKYDFNKNIREKLQQKNKNNKILGRISTIKSTMKKMKEILEIIYKDREIFFENLKIFYEFFYYVNFFLDMNEKNFITNDEQEFLNKKKYLNKYSTKITLIFNQLGLEVTDRKNLLLNIIDNIQILQNNVNKELNNSEVKETLKTLNSIIKSIEDIAKNFENNPSDKISKLNTQFEMIETYYEIKNIREYPEDSIIKKLFESIILEISKYNKKENDNKLLDNKLLDFSKEKAESLTEKDEISFEEMVRKEKLHDSLINYVNFLPQESLPQESSKGRSNEEEENNFLKSIIAKIYLHDNTKE